MVIRYIFSVLVCFTKKNLAILLAIAFQVLHQSTEIITSIIEIYIHRMQLTTHMKKM
jgi:hypothetical protein